MPQSEKNNKSRFTSRNVSAKGSQQKSNSKKTSNQSMLRKNESFDASRSAQTADNIQRETRNAGVMIKRGWKRQVTSDAEQISQSVLHKGSVDLPLLIIFILLIVCGVVMVFSASYAYAYSKYENSYSFIRSQIISTVIGIAAAAIIVFLYDFAMNKGLIRVFVWLYYIATLFLLVLVLFIGRSEGEAKRWIFIGSWSMQPSEFVKGAMIMFLALYFSRHEKSINSAKFVPTTIIGTVLPFLLISPVIALVFLENHTSGVIILGLIAIMMIFFGEKNHLVLVCAIIIGLIAVVIVINMLLGVDKEQATGIVGKIVNSYGWKRIDTWLRPEKYDLRKDLWQSAQGIYAIGSGGFMGVGFGQSRQKHLFVSQPQNDFIYTILCEEMGFIGAVAIILMFAFLIWRGIVVGTRIPDTFTRLGIWGLTASIGLQAFLNIGVVTGMLPNTGISLPFFSYGGSSMLSLLIEVGIILSLSRYAYKAN